MALRISSGALLGPPAVSLTRIQMHPRSPNIGSRPRAPAIKKPPINGGFLLAGLPGLEPRLTESESAVLPLDDSPKGLSLLCTF